MLVAPPALSKPSPSPTIQSQFISKQGRSQNFNPFPNCCIFSDLRVQKVDWKISSTLWFSALCEKVKNLDIVNHDGVMQLWQNVSISSNIVHIPASSSPQALPPLPLPAPAAPPPVAAKPAQPPWPAWPLHILQGAAYHLAAQETNTIKQPTASTRSQPVA